MPSRTCDEVHERTPSQGQKQLKTLIVSFCAARTDSVLITENEYKQKVFLRDADGGGLVASVMSDSFATS